MRSLVFLVALTRVAAADCPIAQPELPSSPSGEAAFTRAVLAWLQDAVAADRARQGEAPDQLGRELRRPPSGEGFAAADVVAAATRLRQLDCAVLRGDLAPDVAARRYDDLAAELRRLTDAIGPPPRAIFAGKLVDRAPSARRELRAGVAMLTLAAATAIGGAVSTSYAVDFARGWSLFYDARDRLIAGAVLCFGATAALAIGGATTLARGASRPRITSFALAPSADGVRAALTLAF